MAYNKTVWINGTAPPINAENLNKIEKGIEDAHAVVPAVDGTTGQVLTKTASGTEWSDAGNPTDTQVAEAVTDWLDENITEIPATAPIVDASLTVQGAAADAKKTGDEISDLKSQIETIEEEIEGGTGSGVPSEVKRAIDSVLQNVALLNDDVYSSELAVIHAWATQTDVVSISAVFTQGDDVFYEGDSLSNLEDDLIVTAYYDDSSSVAVTDYTLSGDLTVGTSTITVTFGGKSATFNVTVSEVEPSWVIGVGFHVETSAQAHPRGICNSHSANNYRAVYVRDRGNDASLIYYADGGEAEESGYHLVPIPTGAIGIRFNSNDANVYMAVNHACYTNDFWYSTNRAEYVNFSRAQYFESNATHLAIYIKNGDAGTSVVTQSMCEAVTIEYIYENDMNWENITFVHDGVAQENTLATISNINMNRGDIIECSFTYSDVSSVPASDAPLRLGTVTNNTPENLWTYKNGYKYLFYNNKSGESVAPTLTMIYNSQVKGQTLSVGSAATTFVVRFDAIGLTVNGKRYMGSAGSTAETYVNNLATYLKTQSTLYAGCHAASTATINYLRVNREV